MSQILQAEELFGDDYRYNGSGTQMMFWCPRCDQDPSEEPKLYVGIETGGFQCKKCGYRGYVHVDIRHLKWSQENRRPPMRLDEVSPLVVSEGDGSWEYLLSRGISPELMRYYTFFTPGDEYYKGGVIVPARDGRHDGFLIRIRDRMASPKWGRMHPDLRWWNSPGFRTSQCIWNAAHVSQFQEIRVAEGVFSATACGRSGVSTYGKDMSNQQFDVLLSLPARRYVFVFDGDDNARLRAWSSAARLHDLGREVWVANCPDDLDPNDVQMKSDISVDEMIETTRVSYTRIRHLRIRREIQKRKRCAIRNTK